MAVDASIATSMHHGVLQLLFGVLSGCNGPTSVFNRTFLCCALRCECCSCGSRFSCRSWRRRRSEWSYLGNAAYVQHVDCHRTTLTVDDSRELRGVVDTRISTHSVAFLLVDVTLFVMPLRFAVCCCVSDAT